VPQTYYQKNLKKIKIKVYIQHDFETKKCYHFTIFFYSLCGFQDDFKQCCTYVDLSNVSTDQFWYSVENWIYSDRIEMLISIGWRWKIVLHAETTYFYKKNRNTKRREREGEEGLMNTL